MEDVKGDRNVTTLEVTDSMRKEKREERARKDARAFGKYVGAMLNRGKLSGYKIA